MKPSPKPLPKIKKGFSEKPENPWYYLEWELLDSNQ